eukprot:Mycagemm_TRINITY_DN10018_c0_g1::TRINITY_DN10018_c0_g1_i1::g.2244::m.2244 type:complete len:186 gc:universal TRINITY_DN10018_c0_g1_i1:650-93(-)
MDTGIVRSLVIISGYKISLDIGKMPIKEHKRNVPFFQVMDLTFGAFAGNDDETVDLPVDEHIQQVPRFVSIFITASYDDRIAITLSLVFDNPRNIGKKRVRNIRDDQPDRMRFSAPQAFGQMIGLVVHFHSYLSDFMSDSLTYSGLFFLPIKDIRYQRRGNACLLCDVFQGCFFHVCSPGLFSCL